MPLIIVIVSIFCLIGLACLAFPKLFIVPEDDEMAMREGMFVIRYWLFGGGGIATLIVRAIFGVFPEFIQKVVVRLVGLGLRVVSLYVGNLLVTAVYPNGYWNSASRQQSKSSPEYTTEMRSEDVEEEPEMEEAVDRQPDQSCPRWSVKFIICPGGIAMKNLSHVILFSFFVVLSFSVSASGLMGNDLEYYSIHPEEYDESNGEPRVRLKVVDESGRPVPYMPFTVEHKNPVNHVRMVTDQNGFSEFTIYGFEKGRYLLLVFPDEYPGVYSIDLPERNILQADWMPDIYHFIDKDSEEISYYLSQGLDVKYSDLEIQEGRKKLYQFVRSLDNKTVHPNYMTLDLSYGEVREVDFVYRKSDLEKPFVLKVVDAENGKPINEFSGTFSVDSYRSLTDLLSSPNCIDLSTGFAQRGLFFPFQSHSGSADVVGVLRLNEYGKVLGKKGAYMDEDIHGCVIMAPGYATQTFPVGSRRFGKVSELQVRMNKEAFVQGRILNKRTKMPYTSDDFKAFSLKQPKDMEYALHLSPEKITQLTNESKLLIKISVNKGSKNNQLFCSLLQDYSKPAYSNKSSVYLDQDGFFKVGGVLPTAGWTLDVCSSIFPRHLEKIDLKPGVNDLGNIFIGSTGELEFKVTNSDLSPVVGAILFLPKENLSDNKAPRTEDQFITDSMGRAVINMSSFIHDEQIVRVFLSGGEQARRSSWCSISYLEADNIPLSRCKDHSLSVVVPGGSLLKIRVNKSEISEKLFDQYVDQAIKMSFGATAKTTKAYIRNIVLKSLDQTSEFTSHRYMSLTDEAGVFRDTREFEFESVPPGRYALRVDFDFVSGDGFTTYAPFNGLYEEFEMPDQPYLHDMEFPVGKVEFALPGPVSNERFFLDRSFIRLDRVDRKWNEKPHWFRLSERNLHVDLYSRKSYFESSGSGDSNRYTSEMYCLPNGTYRLVLGLKGKYTLSEPAVIYEKIIELDEVTTKKIDLPPITMDLESFF